MHARITSAEISPAPRPSRQPKLCAQLLGRLSAPALHCIKTSVRRKRIGCRSTGYSRMPAYSRASSRNETRVCCVADNFHPGQRVRNHGRAASERPQHNVYKYVAGTNLRTTLLHCPPSDRFRRANIRFRNDPRAQCPPSVGDFRTSTTFRATSDPPTERSAPLHRAPLFPIRFLSVVEAPPKGSMLPLRTMKHLPQDAFQIPQLLRKRCYYLQTSESFHARASTS
jgi:hypothetical protein